MNIEDIEKFLSKHQDIEEQYIKIDFKKREPIFGLFLKSGDYSDLKSKNFWRIVTRTHFDEWKKRKDVNLAKIFSGSDFSKLTIYKDSFE
jgi:hypothetical protein